MLREEFLQKATLKHNNKYIYHCAENTIIGNKQIIIECKIHGKFQQRARKHLEGSGCRKCSKNEKLTTKDFINKSIIAHNNKYSYNKSIYTGSFKKIIITCPIHGDFEQSANNHLRGFGCKKCYLENANIEQKYSNNEFIKKAQIAHNNLYTYNNTNYINSKKNVIITCPIHGDFEQIAGNHLLGNGCKKCSETISASHQKIIDILINNNITYEINNRTVIPPYEIDIFVPDLKLGIEYHGVYWHSVKNKKLLHYNKCNEALKNSIKLIQIFENEWLKKKEIVKSILFNNLKLIKNKIFARECVISLIDNNQYDEFCIKNHIQGKRTTNIKLGLLYNDELVCIMGFNKHNQYDYECMRLCSRLNTIIIGGVSKLFSHFLKTYKPKSIISYADRRYSNGSIYYKLNFKLVSITKPNYFYTKDVRVFSRQQFQKHKLYKKLQNFNPKLSESQNMFNNGYRRLWDAGHLKFVWTKC